MALCKHLSSRGSLIVLAQCEFGTNTNLLVCCFCFLFLLLFFSGFVKIDLSFLADFSDRISRNRRVGYESGDFEIVSSFS